MARPTFGGLAPLPVMPGCLPCVRQSQMQMCISTFQVPFRDQTSFLPLDRQPTAARGGGMARPSNRLVPRQTRQTMTVMPTATERSGGRQTARPRHGSGSGHQQLQHRPPPPPPLVAAAAAAVPVVQFHPSPTDSQLYGPSMQQGFPNSGRTCDL